jgi:GAF domain-containing protein
MRQRGGSEQPVKGRRANRPKPRTIATPSIADLQKQVGALTRELKEAREEQTATTEVLQIINASPGDLAPVFDAILEKAHSLCAVAHGALLLYDGEKFRAAAVRGLSEALAELLRQGFIPGPNHPSQRLLEGARFAQVPDWAEIDDPVARGTLGAGIRTTLLIPLRSEGKLLGNISASRPVVRPFSETEIALLESFAAQAVIAIENARLFNETQEALEQQTATAEVLRVINASPGNLAPVFDAMIEEAIRLCDAVSGHFRTYDGNSFSLAAVRGAAEHVEAMRQSGPLVPGPHHPVSRFLRGENLIHIPNTKESEEYRTDARFRSLVDLGVLSLLSASLRKDSVLLGYINVYRHAAKPFTNRQIALLQNFAAQAVVAMENARLLGELRQRTDELTEALVYQTGSSNILKVIASSPTDVGPALQAIVDSACEICDAPDAAVFLKDGHDLVFSAHHGSMPNPIGRWPINRNWVTGRAVMDKVPQQAHDLLGQSGDEFPEARNVFPGQVHRTVLSIPLLQEGDAIGAISLRRMEAQPFSEK